MSLQSGPLETQPFRRRMQRKTTVGGSFVASPLQSMPRSTEAADQTSPRYQLCAKARCTHVRTEKSARTLSSLTHLRVFDEIIRYAGFCGFLPTQCASRQHQQKCNNDVLLRRLSEDVGVHLTQQSSIKKLKQACCVASFFPGQAWEMCTTKETDNFITCGLRAITKLPKDAGPLLRVSSFTLTPNEARHLTHMVDGLESDPDTYQPLPDAPHIDQHHEFYLQLQAPLSIELGKLSIPFGALDLYITWESGELLLCVGVSGIAHGFPEIVQEEFRNRCAILYPVDHQDGKFHEPGCIHLAPFDFGNPWFDCWDDTPKILPVLRSLVSEGQVRCLLAFPKKQSAIE
mmetsp:Transcript_11341/g.20107  ORF Transcript_11341/g.20107 Transcript_11341/m.20107 type:complete len:345 (+) Transcript_11341:66-1100(+)